MQASHSRQAGILLPAFSPRREGDLGIGDTLALRGWVDWAAQHGVSFIQLLPINENGPDESPYTAISSVALDPIYLAIEPTEVPWLSAADIDKSREQLGGALTAEWVDYPAVRRTKRRLLELAWSKFADFSQPEEQAEFAAFREAEAGWLDDYCVFRFLMEHHGEPLTWDRWPASCQTASKARAYLAKLRHHDTATVDYRLHFFAFVQWLCFRQWRALRAHADSCGVKLMGDVPIGVCWHSCDVFFQREEFHLDWCGGSPPEGQSDPFFQQWGQNWGIPLYRWDHMEANGYKWWKTRIVRLTEIFRIFRLDHILGFYRFYAFPWRPQRNPEFIGLSHEQAAAINHGRLPRWFMHPDDTAEHKAANCADGDQRLRAILDAAHGAEVIAEDLGWVPDYVRPHLAGLDIAGFRIPHWDCNDAGHPTPGDHFPENSFASYSTHDHDPVNGIWNNCLDVIRRQQENPQEVPEWHANGAHHTLRVLSEFAGIPIPVRGPWPPFTEGVRLRLVKALLASKSRYAVLMVTELFNLNVRINQPGTVGNFNWRFRMPWTLKTIMADPQLQDICRKFAATISVTKRAPHSS